jgi:subtilisin family serine protease
VPALAAPGGRPGPRATAPPGTPAYQVTLITGDRVRVTTLPGGRPGVTIIPGPRRAGLAFHVAVEGPVDGLPGISVVPQDAAALLAQGALDPRLFDVSLLAQEGDDDASSGTLPVIVAYRSAGAPSAGTPALAATPGGLGATALPSIGAAATGVRKASAERWWSAMTGATPANGFLPGAALSHGAATIWLDATVRAADEAANAQIGVPVAWHKGLRGNGVLVADLDSGYDQRHPDLAGRVAASKDFTHSANGVQDSFGHGTATASALAGTGVRSHGRYAGVAPWARLLIGKVLGNQGAGLESQVIAGMQWAVRLHAKVVNMSLGGPPSDGTDPLSQAVDRLSRGGTLFVVAAGNDGPSPSSITSPGAATAALTVGAVDARNRLAPFSSLGPRLGDSAIKPDITSPGVSVVVARAAGTDLGVGDGYNDGPIGRYYSRLSGTSIATPIVSGAAAILAQQHPRWTGQQLKAGLMGTAADPVPGLGVFSQGDGRVDVARAVTQHVYPSLGSVSGHAAWPHPPTVSRAVTYANDGAAAATLHLALSLTGPDGKPADGLASLSASRLTVPGHGRATVTITFGSGAARLGEYAGVLAATGGASVRTAVGFYVAPRFFTLRVKILNRAGAVGPGSFLGTVVNTATGYQPSAIAFHRATGSYTMRLPAGTYYVSGEGDQPAAGHFHGSRAAVIAPSVRLTRDTSLVLDGRDAAPVVTTVDHPDAAPILEFLDVDQLIAGAGIADAFASWSQGPGVPAPALYITPTPRIAGRSFMFSNHTSFASPASSPYAVPGAPAGYEYNLFFRHDGAVPAGAGLVHHVRTAILARVRTGYALQGPRLARGDTAQVGNLPLRPGFLLSFDVPVFVAPGGAATQYYTAAPHLTWHRDFFVNDARFAPFEDAPPVSYLGGRAYRSSFGEAALGTAMTLLRTGDQVLFAPSLFSPSEPGHVAYDYQTAARVRTTLALGRRVLGVLADDPLPAFTVPAAPARYTLTERATRPASWSVLGTRASVTWRFHTGHTAGLTIFNLIDTRVSGPFGSHDSAPAGRPVPVRFSVEHATGPVTRVALAVSYDDGAHWRPVRLVRAGDHWLALIDSPRAARYVSLRTAAADAGGDTVASAVIRAYALSRPAA